MRAAPADLALPALGSALVGFARVDPAVALRRQFLFPERRARLEIIHQKLARLNRLAAVRRSDRDEHDLISRPQQSAAMNPQRIVNLPARLCLGDDFLDRALSHAGIMLERELADLGGIVDVPHHADEAGNRADFCIALAQPGDLQSGVEIFLLHTHRHIQPPVTGGKIATSSPSEIAASNVVIDRLTATCRFFAASASAQTPPRRRSQSRISPTLRTSTGAATVSRLMPRRSLRPAK